MGEEERERKEEKGRDGGRDIIRLCLTGNKLLHFGRRESDLFNIPDPRPDNYKKKKKTDIHTKCGKSENSENHCSLWLGPHYFPSHPKTSHWRVTFS